MLIDLSSQKTMNNKKGCQHKYEFISDPYGGGYWFCLDCWHRIFKQEGVFMSQLVRVVIAVVLVAFLVGGIKACGVAHAGDVYGTTHTTHTTHVTPSKPVQPKVESFKPNPFWKWFLGK